jgi:uncharacterized protein (TIGR02284 family)
MVLEPPDANKTSIMKTNEKVLDLLNDLIQINNDRIAGYGKAANEVSPEEADLKQLFRQYAKESSEYVQELSKEIEYAGGKAATSTTISGKIYRVWMDMKAALNKDERQSALESCEYGEDAAQKAYQKALESDFEIPVRIREMIARQKGSLRSAHDEIKSYRDSHVEIR